jgi:hypothetical protein
LKTIFGVVIFDTDVPVQKQRSVRRMNKTKISVC